MFETRQLQLLQVIASHGSYSAAGRELGLTQPAITYQMRALERQVGTALAVRRGRYMRLTPAGEALLDHADRVLATLRAAEEELGHLIGRDAGVVRIASFPSASATIVADTMVRARSSATRLSFVQDETAGARARVRRGEADIAITYRFESRNPADAEGDVDEEVGGLLRHPLFRDEMRLIVPAGHPVAGGGPVHPAELRDETWFLASERFQSQVRRLAGPGEPAPRITVVADDYVSLQALVARKLGVALVPGLALAAHQSDGIVACAVSEEIADWPVRVIQAEVWSDVLRIPAISATLGVLVEVGQEYERRLGAVGRGAAG